MPVREIFIGMLEERRFEACEFSLANYITLRGRGERWLHAIPVFPYRAFRHGFAVTRRDSALTSLRDLEGMRVGVEDYSMTAAVWFRGLLHDEFGIDARSINWVTCEKQRFAFPGGANIEATRGDLEEMLVSGAIDVLLGFSLRDNALPPLERRLRPVLADPQAEEEAYYERTGIYPIMHCVAVREDAVEKHPRAAAALCAAYASAKARACRRQLGTTLAPWGKNHWARTFALFGGDPLPYGLTPANRNVIEKLVAYLKVQGFIDALPGVDELFLDPTRP
jgi:4,5-dihydroxyphthalate decarboxylase